MKVSVLKTNNSVVFGLPFLMILSMIILSKSDVFSQNQPQLSIAITLDLLITVPFIYYLLIRKKDIPKITVISSFVLGLVVASYILPENNQTLLSQIKLYVLPFIEIGILSFIVIKARKIITEFKKNKHNSLDFYDALLLACKDVFPKNIASLLATEIAVIYYGFVSWSKKSFVNNEFSYHKNSGIHGVLIGFMMVIALETVTLHILALKWSVTFAWILSFLSVYTCLQMFALLRSLSKRPIYLNVEQGKLVLKFGFFSEADIPFKMIKTFEINQKDLPEDKSIVPFSPLGSLTPHNVILHLEKEHTFNGFYGFKKKYNSLAFFVDDKQRFKEMLNAALANQK